METTVIRRTDLSGTSFVIDVSGLNLSSTLSVKDFTVTHAGVDVTVAYAKTNQTQITYTGASVLLGTRVEVVRTTPLSFTETSFISTTTASELTNALSKLKRRVDEIEALAAWQSALIQQGGLTLGTVPVLDTVFGASWNGNVSSAPSLNSVYDGLYTTKDPGAYVLASGFVNSWANFSPDTFWETFRFRRFGSGLCHITGILAKTGNPTGGEIICNFPYATFSGRAQSIPCHFSVLGTPAYYTGGWLFVDSANGKIKFGELAPRQTGTVTGIEFCLVNAWVQTPVIP